MIRGGTQGDDDLARPAVDLVHGLDRVEHSEKPDHGYRISRLAADLDDLIRTHDLNNVTLIGHSMGSSVIWSYLEQFGETNIERMAFVDQASAIVGEPGWSEEERLNAGAILSAQEAADLVARLAKDDGSLSNAFVTGMFSSVYPATDLTWVLAQNAPLPRAYASRLFYDHAFKNWQDVIRRISRPCLCVGARRSIVPWQAMLATGKSIRTAQTFIFQEEDGGSHFMFLENPIKFNYILAFFLSDRQK